MHSPGLGSLRLRLARLVSCNEVIFPDAIHALNEELRLCCNQTLLSHVQTGVVLPQLHYLLQKLPDLF